MATWAHKVNLYEFVNDDNIELLEGRTMLGNNPEFVRIRDGIVAAFRNSTVWKIANRRGPDGDTLAVIIDEMADATDIDHINCCLAAAYDWADRHRLWIETICPEPAMADR